MKLFTKTIRQQLIQNGLEQKSVRGTEEEIDFNPVVKLFTPDANCTWLLTEIDPDDKDIVFGLCDLGMGSPELGSVRISELEQIRGAFGLPVERDLHFKADKTLMGYAREAWTLGYIKT